MCHPTLKCVVCCRHSFLQKLSVFEASRMLFAFLKFGCKQIRQTNLLNRKLLFAIFLCSRNRTLKGAVFVKFLDITILGIFVLISLIIFQKPIEVSSQSEISNLTDNTKISLSGKVTEEKPYNSFTLFKLDNREL